MPAEWYYQEFGEPVGPLTTSELRTHARNGRIGPDAFVRKGPNGKWVPANKVKGLFDESFQVQKSPLPPKEKSIPSFPSEQFEGTRANVAKFEQTKKIRFRIIVASSFAAMFLIFGIIWLVVPRNASQGKSEPVVKNAQKTQQNNGNAKLDSERLEQENRLRLELQARQEAERRVQELEFAVKQERDRQERDRMARLEAERLANQQRDGSVTTKKDATRKPIDVPTERLDIDPVLQGIWKIHGISEDKGRTVEEVNGIVLARVSSTKIKTQEGDLIVEKVLIVKDSKGSPANLIRFKNGVVWGITKEPNQPFVVVQVFDVNDRSLNTEKVRFLITVED